MLDVDGFYTGKNDEEIADGISRLLALRSKIDRLISWRKTVLMNRMLRDGCVRMKTKRGTTAEFRPQFATTPSQRRRARALDPYFHVKGKA